MNIVFGGTFNPPTIAHENIVIKLKELFHPENIIIVPTGKSYTWKDNSNYDYRIDLAKLAFKDCIICDYELSGAYKGTYNTLNKLKERYDDLYFVMGADNLNNLDKWLNIEKLLSEYKFIIFNRDNNDLDSIIDQKFKEYKDHFTIIDFDYNVSSTAFRLNLDKSLVSLEVYKYIIDNNLYKED